MLPEPLRGSVICYSCFGSLYFFAEAALVAVRGLCFHFYISQIFTPLVADGHKDRPINRLIHFRNLSN